MLESFNCRVCGGELIPKDGGTYKCACCGSTFIRKAEEDFAEKLRDVLREEKFEKVSAARQNLWRAMHEQYISSGACLAYARELKSLVPSDYYANFAETVNEKNDEEITNFLNTSSKEDMETYADAVLDFMTRSMTQGTTTAVCGFIDRAFTNKTSPEYAKYVNLYEREAEKVNAGIYELTLPRDVFLAYSSSDMPKVLELCEYLEGEEVSCFLAMRNLRHGRGAADNYDSALKTAMENCRIFLYISSENSRKIGCDAYRIEIPYIRRKDLEVAPSEFRNASYEKLPSRYKKNRIEYLLDEYRGSPTDKAVKEFFAGYEWCRTKEDVAERVIRYLTSEPETDDTPEKISDEYLQKIISAVSADVGASVSIETKEKNVLDHVVSLIKMGGFDEAVKTLSELEKDEVSVQGAASPVVYYYKVLAAYGVKSSDEFVTRLVNSGASLKSNSDYLILQSGPDNSYKSTLGDVETRAQKLIAERRRIEAENRKVSEGLVYRKNGYGYVTCVKMGKCRDAVVGIAKSWGGVAVSDIGMGAFKNCDKVTRVIIPEGVELIGQRAFMNCSSLKDVTMPKSISKINDDAFKNCSSLSCVIIPQGVSVIKPGTFSGCTALSEIVLPASVKRIWKDAFDGCVGLKRIYYGGDTASWEKVSGVGSLFSGRSGAQGTVKTYFYSPTKRPGKDLWYIDGGGKPAVWQ